MQSFDTLDAYWQDIRTIPSLSDEEERALALRIQQGDDRALDKLVTANLRFVVSIARQYADKGLSMDDLISEGNIALMMAAKKWQPKEEDARFVNYAVWDVRKAMQQALPEQAAMITLPKNGGNEHENVKRYSTDAPMHPGQTNTLGDMLKSGKPMTEDGVENKEVSYSLMKAMRCLGEREKNVITKYYGIGTEEHLTMAEIAEQTGLKRERVRQIRKTAERKMRKILKNMNKLLVLVMLAALSNAAMADGRIAQLQTLESRVSYNASTFSKAKKDKSKDEKKKDKKKKAEKNNSLEKTDIYIYGVARSVTDSVVYVTDEMLLPNTLMFKKSKFLYCREQLSGQLSKALEAKGEGKRICSVTFAKSIKKLDRKFAKQVKRLKKEGFLVKSIGQGEFKFTAIEKE